MCSHAQLLKNAACSYTRRIFFIIHKTWRRQISTNKFFFSRGNETEKREDGKEMAFVTARALAHTEMSSDCRRIYCFKKTWNWDLRAEPALPPPSPLRKALLCVIHYEKSVNLWTCIYPWTVFPFFSVYFSNKNTIYFLTATISILLFAIGFIYLYNCVHKIIYFLICIL